MRGGEGETRRVWEKYKHVKKVERWRGQGGCIVREKEEGRHGIQDGRNKRDGRQEKGQELETAE